MVSFIVFKQGPKSSEKASGRIPCNYLNWLGIPSINFRFGKVSLISLVSAELLACETEGNLKYFLVNMINGVNHSQEMVNLLLILHRIGLFLENWHCINCCMLCFEQCLLVCLITVQASWRIFIKQMTRQTFSEIYYL